MAAQLIPQVEQCNIQTATMRLFNRMCRFLEGRPDLRLMEIAEDGKIDETERQDLDAILEELDGLTKVFMEIRLAAK